MKYLTKEDLLLVFIVSIQFENHLQF